MQLEILPLPRPTLLSTLTQAVSKHALTLVVAPMGYAKTTTAKSLTKSLGTPTFLFTLPPTPHDKHWLWNLFCTQLEKQRQPAAKPLRRTGPPETPHAIQTFLKEIALNDRPAVLILDNCQNLSSPSINELFETVSEMKNPPLHLALFSRTRPAAQLEKHIANGRAIVFNEELMRFSKDEAEQYFKLHGILNTQTAHQAWEMCEGWPAAMGLSLKSWLDTGDVQRLPDLESLLAKSVLDEFSGAERSLLMRLSIMDSFNANDIKALGGKHTHDRLKDFCDANVMLVHDEKLGLYRFHRLVRGFLFRKLAASHDDSLPSLYKRAAECHVRRHEPLHALRLLLRARQDADLVRALALFLMPGAEKMFAPSPEEVRTAVKQIPWRIRARHPLGFLAFVRLYLSTGGDAKAVDWWLVEAETHLLRDSGPMKKSRNRLEGEMAIITGLLAFNDMDALWSRFDQALTILRGPSRIHPKSLGWGFGSPHLSFVCLREAGTFNDIVKKAASAEKTLTALTDGHGAGSAEIIRLEHSLEQGFVDEMETGLVSLEQTLKNSVRPAATLHARFIRARLLVSRGEHDDAVAALEALQSEMREPECRAHLETLELALDYINACGGRHENVSQWLRDGDMLLPPRGAVQRHSFLFVIYGKTLIASENYERLGAVTKNMPLRLTGHDSVFSRIHAKIFEAIVLQQVQGVRSAMDALRDAVELSRPDGLVFAFTEYWKHLSPLFRGVRRENGNDPHVNRIQAFAESLRSHSAANEAKSRAELTLREEEIMRLMVKGMTNAAIGKELGISSDAVKKALTLVYGKLGAANRIQASRLFGSREARTKL